MSMQRYLDVFESQTLDGWNTAAVATGYTGYVEENALAQAFELLVDHHPVLRGRVRRDSKGYQLYVPAEHQPQFIVVDGNKDTVQREISKRVDITKGIARLTLVRNEKRGFVVLHALGSVVGWGGISTQIVELWELYTKIVCGNELPKPRPLSLPPSAMDLFARHGVRVHPALLGEATHPPIEMGPASTRNVVLSETETQHIMAAAHTHESTVHGLVCGAIVVALRDHGTGSESTPMICTSVIDLRNKVDPPVAATDATSFAIRHKAHLTVTPNADPIDVGKNIREQIDTALASWEFSVDPIESPPAQIDTALEQRLAHVMVSNVGALPRFSLPSGVSITELYTPKDVMAMFCAVGVFTCEGQMNIECIFPTKLFSEEEAEQITKRVAANLSRIECAADQ